MYEECTELPRSLVRQGELRFFVETETETLIYTAGRSSVEAASGGQA